MTTYTGYSAQIWQACYTALNFLQTLLGGTPEQSVSAATAVLQTLLNGVEAIDANDLSSAWRTEISYLQQIQALPLVVAPADAAIFNARVSTYEAAQVALAPLVPQAPFPSGVLANGTPSIPSTGLLAFYLQFGYETPPAGLTPANLTAQAQSVAASLANIAIDIQTFQGMNVTQLYDVAVREAAVANNAAAMLAAFTAGPVAIASSGVWNTLVALPACAQCADIVNSAPATFASQQSAVIRNRLLTSASQIANYLLTLRSTQGQQISIATLRNNESLMDFAARTLGNFELWQQVAAVNNLVPPYVAATAGYGIAAWGSSLILPTPGVTASATGAAPSYAVNFLGTDINVGPINGAMPPWMGDYQLITGYSNLRWALGRRLQTTLGTLIYHLAYGSRIPPEVGAVQDNSTAGNIAAYGQGALLSDPRVQSVPQATATLVEQGVEFDGTVLPAGFSTPGINVNEVIGVNP